VGLGKGKKQPNKHELAKRAMQTKDNFIWDDAPSFILEFLINDVLFQFNKAHQLVCQKKNVSIRNQQMYLQYAMLGWDRIRIHTIPKSPLPIAYFY
jgi:hypothetical protein